MEQAHAFIIKHMPDLLMQLCSFQAETEHLLKTQVYAGHIENLGPSVWWLFIEKICKNASTEAYDLAITLLRLPSSSASTERIFSYSG